MSSIPPQPRKRRAHILNRAEVRRLVALSGHMTSQAFLLAIERRIKGLIGWATEVADQCQEVTVKPHHLVGSYPNALDPRARQP